MRVPIALFLVLLAVGLDPPGDLRVEEVAPRNRALIEATAPYAACFKPNLAFYEQSGILGVARVPQRQPTSTAYVGGPEASGITEGRAQTDYRRHRR